MSTQRFMGTVFAKYLGRSDGEESFGYFPGENMKCSSLQEAVDYIHKGYSQTYQPVAWSEESVLNYGGTKAWSVLFEESKKAGRLIRQVIEKGDNGDTVRGYTIMGESASLISTKAAPTSKVSDIDAILLDADAKAVFKKVYEKPQYEVEAVIDGKLEGSNHPADVAMMKRDRQPSTFAVKATSQTVPSTSLVKELPAYPGLGMVSSFGRFG